MRSLIPEVVNRWLLNVFMSRWYRHRSDADVIKLNPEIAKIRNTLIYFIIRHLLSVGRYNLKFYFYVVSHINSGLSLYPCL